MTDIETTALHGMAIDIVSVGDDRRKLGDELNGLPHEIVARDVIGIRIEGVHLQHATCQDVHNVAAFQVDNVHNRTMVEWHVLIDQFAESRQLLFVGQIAGEKQISNFFKAEAFLFQQWRDKIVKFIATIIESSRARAQRTIIIALIANDITDVCQTHKYSRAVLIAQSTLHTILSKSLTRDFARVLHLIAQLVYQIFLSHSIVTFSLLQNTFDDSVTEFSCAQRFSIGHHPRKVGRSRVVAIKLCQALLDGLSGLFPSDIVEHHHSRKQKT